MKKILVTGIFFILITIIGCQNKKTIEPTLLGEVETENCNISNSRGNSITPMGIAYPGVMVVKVLDTAINDFKIDEDKQVKLQNLPKPMNMALESIKTVKIERLFPPAGKYEERSRKLGMHLWYIINFDKEVNLSTAMNKIASLEEIELVECMPVVKLMNTNESAMVGVVKEGIYPSRLNIVPFDDPLLSDQWHYNNVGQVNGAIEGADINLFEA